MESGYVTTPFGRRPMTLALIKGQLEVAGSKSNARVEKWKVFRDICEARERFGLQDRALAVLDALLSFYQDAVLDPERGLVVFPSNAQLSVRAHGIAGTTLRRHLAALCQAGLVQRRDSPNGKRYAHRNRDGKIEQAYGFDLTPLVARAGEFSALAQDVVAERTRVRRLKEALTICRRDVRKLISVAMSEGANGDWHLIESQYSDILHRLPRTPVPAQIEEAVVEMEQLRQEILNQLEIRLNSQKTDGNDVQNGRHLQNSESESSIEFEPCSGKKQGGISDSTRETAMVRYAKSPMIPNPIRTFPLGMVLRACPQIVDYGPVGGIANWRELMAAAVLVRSMLGVSPSAYQEACDVMGQENAAVAMACIFERANVISSAGGYLRDLTKRSERGEFSLGPMLMALLKSSRAGIASTGT